jgi:hypothetical protein
MQDRAHARHREVGLDVFLVVPAERGDDVTDLDTQRRESGGEPTGALVGVAKLTRRAWCVGDEEVVGVRDGGLRADRDPDVAVGEHAHRHEHVRRFAGGGSARRPGVHREPRVVEGGDEPLTVDVERAGRDDPGMGVGERPVDGDVVDQLRQPRPEVAADQLPVRSVRSASRRGDLERDRGRGDRRDVLEPGASPSLPLVALEQRRDPPTRTDRRGTRCRADHRTWRRRRQQVGTELLERSRRAGRRSGRRRRGAAHPLAAGLGHLVGRLDRPDLVVGVLQVDASVSVPEDGRHLVGVDQPGAVDPDDVELVAVLVAEPFGRPAAPRSARRRSTTRWRRDSRGAPPPGRRRGRRGGPPRSRPRSRPGRARSAPTAAAAVAVARSSRSRAARPSRCRREGSPCTTSLRRATPVAPPGAAARRRRDRGSDGVHARTVGGRPRSGQGRAGTAVALPLRADAWLRWTSEEGGRGAGPGGLRGRARSGCAPSARCGSHADAEVVECASAARRQAPAAGRRRGRSTCWSSTATCARVAASPCSTTCGSGPGVGQLSLAAGAGDGRP